MNVLGMNTRRTSSGGPNGGNNPIRGRFRLVVPRALLRCTSCRGLCTLPQLTEETDGDMGSGYGKHWPTDLTGARC